MWHIANSNPCSREGSDSNNIRNHDNSHDFNPRSREGSDRIKVSRLPMEVIFQSTLPRGERLLQLVFFGRCSLFQSTLPRGERHFEVYEGKDHTEFQSTLPRGERHNYTLTYQSHSHYFNPRSREGSDSNFYPKSYLILGKNCLKLLKSLNISILQNIFKHSMTYFQVRIPPSIYVSLAFAPNL